jgi:hypothetical protein
VAEGVVPASLSWVPLFVDSANRALDGDIIEATLEPRTDPLQWVLVLTSKWSWNVRVVAGLRQILKDWCKVNDAEYKKSAWDERVFKALVIVRGLGPERKVNPYEENNDAAKRRARSLDR